MSDVKRYDYDDGGMIELSFGDYVHHDDYAAINAECERLTREQGEGTTGNKYRAELYDEVWQRAREMGFENVTMALSELAALKAPAVAEGVEVVAESFTMEAISAARGLVTHIRPTTDLPDGTRLMTVTQHNAIVASLRQPVASEREAFEAWYERTFSARAFSRNVDHSYQVPETEILWAGWQARATRPAQTEQQPVAWLIDWPEEPELGHYFSDEPNEHARSRPLYAAPIAQTRADGLVEALRDARELIVQSNCDTGVCCCGSPVDAHGFGDGHSPVDEGGYQQLGTLKRIDAALAAHRAGGAGNE